MARARVFLIGAAIACLTLGCGGPASVRRHPRLQPSALEMPPDPRAAAVIQFTEEQIGKRYCWGGTGPSCFDCSGLVQAAWRHAGARVPRTSEAQARALLEVRLEDVQPGDVFWWPGHVAVYIGRGVMVDAYHSGAGVVRRPANVPERVLRVPRSVAGTR